MYIHSSLSEIKTMTKINEEMIMIRWNRATLCSIDYDKCKFINMVGYCKLKFSLEYMKSLEFGHLPKQCLLSYKSYKEAFASMCIENIMSEEEI